MVPALTSMSSMRAKVSLLLTTLSQGVRMPPKQLPAPVLKTPTCAPPAVCPVPFPRLRLFRRCVSWCNPPVSHTNLASHHPLLRLLMQKGHPGARPSCPRSCRGLRARAWSCCSSTSRSHHAPALAPWGRTPHSRSTCSPRKSSPRVTPSSGEAAPQQRPFATQTRSAKYFQQDKARESPCDGS